MSRTAPRPDDPNAPSAPPKVRCVLYVSTAAREMTTPDLVALLKVTRSNNQARGLTGMLLYRGGNFMQALEGPPDVVGETLGRICADPRHRDVTLIADVLEPARHFAQWQMGFAHLNDDDVADIPGFTEFLRVGLRATEIIGNPGFALKMLQHFRDNMR